MEINFDYQINQILDCENYFAVITDEKYIFIFDSVSFQLVKKLVGHKQSVLSIYYMKKILISSSRDKSIIVWNLETFQKEKIISYHVEVCQVIAFQEMIICGDYYGQMQAWSLKDQEKIQGFKAHQQQITNIKCNSTSFISLSFDNKLKLWDEKFQVQNELQDERIQIKFVQDCLQMDENIIVLGQIKNNSLMIINSSNLTIAKIIENIHSFTVFGVALFENIIATGSKDLKLKIWDNNYEITKELEGHKESIRAVSFIQNGKYVLSAGCDNVLKFWNLSEK